MSSDAAIDFADEMAKGAPASSGDPAIDMAMAGGGHAEARPIMPDGRKLGETRKGAGDYDAPTAARDTQILKARNSTAPDSPLGVVAHKTFAGLEGAGRRVVSGYRGLADLATGQGLATASADINSINANATPYREDPRLSPTAAVAGEAMDSPANPLNWIPKGAELLGRGATAGLRAAGAGPELSQGVGRGIAEAGPWALGLAAPKGSPMAEAAPGEMSTFEPPTKAHGPSVSDQILADSRRAGYVVPPATTNPNILNRTIEGVAGKASVAQLAAIKNQPITDNLARRALNLPPDAELTPETMEAVRAPAGEVYGRVAGVGRFTVDDQYKADLAKLSEAAKVIQSDLPKYRSGAQAEVQELSEALHPENGTMDASTAVALSKDLRKNANSNYSLAARTGDSTRLDIARAQQAAAAAVEDQLSRHLESIGQSELSGEWDNARRTIAKSYSVQNALDGAGHVDATKLGKQLIKGKPLSGELETAANFANAFPKAARVLPGKESNPGMSPLDVYGSVAAAVGTGNPIPLVIGPGRMGARSLALSKALQAKPSEP
jgi:hypothetical protein